MADRMGGSDQHREDTHGADWNQEREYWKQTYSSRPYADANRDFTEFEPGYRYGYESAQRHGTRGWEAAETDLQRDWDGYEHGGDNRSTWEQVKDSVRDAWDRVTGDDDRNRTR